MAEQVILSGKDFLCDPNCLIHRSGRNLSITLKKFIIRRLGLKPRDILKIYVCKEGHEVAPPKDVNTVLMAQSNSSTEKEYLEKIEKDILNYESAPLKLTYKAKVLVDEYLSETDEDEKRRIFKKLSYEMGGDHLAKAVIEMH